MTTPDVEDASPSPEYSGDPDGDDMTEPKTENSPREGSPSSQPATNKEKPSSNAKDPLRPRRKKARRACLACQRAHLTCGDERPCHRCVKRGLQDNCMDGVRKKAKYLHDAPNEALMPGVGGQYAHLNGVTVSIPGQGPQGVSLGPQPAFYGQPPPGNYAVYPHAQQNTMPAQMQNDVNVTPFTHQQTPISPPYNQPTHGLPTMSDAVTQAQQQQQEMHQFGGPLFDPSDPALFNLDIANLNFGNHFGALEFGILGHMTSGVAQAQEQENHLMNPLNQAANEYGAQLAAGTFADGPGMTPNPAFGQDGMPGQDWHPHSRNGSTHIQTPNNTPITTTIDTLRHDSLTNPHAYAIGQGPSSLSSASPASTDMTAGYDNDHPMQNAGFYANANAQRIQQHPSQQHPSQHPSPSLNRQSHEPPRRAPPMPLQPIQFNAMKKRRRDTSHIYDGIKEPYQYVTAFHRLHNIIEGRFSKTAVLKMMRSLAKFRPLLMAAAAEQDRNDLIQNEKNLRRQLMTLEDMMVEIGTPVLICRRSAEIVLMNAEFNQLTGWPKDVLLGRKPNLNVNIGNGRDPANETATSSRNSRTPIMPGQEPDPGPWPVPVVELMDEASAIQFIEDFSTLAFGDPRGSVVRRVKLLKYRTKEDLAKLQDRRADAFTNGKGSNQDQQNGGEHTDAGIRMVGERLGMVECMIQWHVKRDIHDMPVLLLLCILPILS